MALYFSQLFPPVIPPNLPSYDGTKTLRMYFNMSVANSRDQFQHAQIIVNKLDTNLNALNTSTYPVGIIFVYNSQILFDDSVGMHCIDLPSNLLSLDAVYKMQIRLGAQDLNNVTNLDYTWLNKESEFNQFSEWSTVCLIKPITVPTFNMVGFTSKDSNGNYVQPVYVTDNVVNVANTPGFLFTGAYAAAGTNKEEILKSYRFVLYEDNGTTIEASWKTLKDSGDLYIGQYEAVHIQHSFDYTLEKGKTYYVKFIVTSKNGYVDSKIYKTLVMYADVNLYNTFHVTPNQDLAKVSLHVQGKQLLFKAENGTVVEPTKDAVVPDSILHTHMIVNGTIKEKDNLTFDSSDGTLAIQMRAMGIKPMENRSLALKNPILLLEETPLTQGGSYQKIKLCAAKYKVSFDDEVIPRYVNEFILSKEVWDKSGMLFKQTKNVSLGADFIGPMNEYYFFIKENKGLMELSAQKIRVSTNTELPNYVNQYKFNS